jgi:hypothetical protein
MTKYRLTRTLAAVSAFFAISAAPACATNVLLFADNPGSATTSCEYLLITNGVCGAATGLGWTATVVATNTAASQPYGSYDAVVFSSRGTFGALATFNTPGGPQSFPAWAAAVPGNVILIGTDPQLHGQNNSPAAAAQMIKSAIQFAASGAKPGAVVLFNGLYNAAPANTPVPVLAGFESTTGGNCGTGKFGVQATNLETAHKVAIHPALAGLTNALMSNWYQSSHNGFNCWPAGFTPLATLSDLPAGDSRLIWTGTDAETGASVTGFPYILARGATPAGPPRPVDCCPPIDQSNFTSMLSEVPTGGIMDPYLVRFMTNATSELQMQSYFNYVSAMDTTITGVDLYLYLVDCGDNNVPTATFCSGSIMGNAEMLTWNAASGMSSTPDAPWRSEWVSPSWTNACAPSFTSNCIAWTQIFNQPLVVNHRYEILAFPAIERANGTREVLWDRCPIVFHQVNHMQAPIAPKGAGSITLQEFEKFEIGKEIIKDFKRISRPLRAPEPPHSPPQQMPKGADRH